MNSSAQEIQPWSTRKWSLAIGAAALLQLTLIWMLGARPAGARYQPDAFSLSLPPQSAETAGTSLSLWDPTLFAMGNRQGFSGSAWLQPPPLRHEYHEWSNGVHWLTPDQQVLGQGFVQFVRAQEGAMVFPVAEKPATEPFLRRAPEATGLLRNASVLRLEGPLQLRAPAAPPILPAWPSEEPLRPTEVQVVVNEDGTVVSAVATGESGLVVADQKAVAIARGLAFQAPAGQTVTTRVTVGKIVFDWLVVAPKPAP